MGSVRVRARLGLGARGLQRRRRRVVLVSARPRPVARLPLERGRDGRPVRRVRPPEPWPGAVEREATRSSRSGCSGSPTARATTARTSRTTGGTSTPSPAARGCAGGTTTPRPPSRTRSLIDENARRSKLDPEFELLDTGIFDDDRYWIVEVEYAKADPTDILARITVRNAGPDTATIHVLPTIWFRNEWSYDPAGPRPTLRGRCGWVADPRLAPRARRLRAARRARTRRRGARRCCSARTRPTRRGSSASPATTPYPKDGINDHVVRGAATVNPAGTGTKAAAWYRLEVEPGETAEIRLRLRPRAPAIAPAEAADARDLLGAGFEATMAARVAEADAFYEDLAPAGRDRRRGARSCARRSPGCCGASSTTATTSPAWLNGDPAGPRPPAERLTGRNAGWRHFDAADILSMPDPWEYPWFAAWDLAFHTITLAHIDPAFAKYQLLVHVPGVVPAPQRRAARLRVVVRRRQPAGPRHRRDRRVADRRQPGHRVPAADLPQAAAQLHVVAQPRRTRRATTCSRAASWASTT